jgi:hypothetical protein
MPEPLTCIQTTPRPVQDQVLTMALKLLQVRILHAVNIYASTESELHPVHYVKITCEEPDRRCFITASAPGSNPFWPCQIFKFEVASHSVMVVSVYLASGNAEMDKLMWKGEFHPSCFSDEWRDLSFSLSSSYELENQDGLSSVMYVAGRLVDAASLKGSVAEKVEGVQELQESKSPGVQGSMARVAGEAAQPRSPGVQVSMAEPGCQTLRFDLRVSSDAVAKLDQIRMALAQIPKGKPEFEGICRGADPLVHLNYVCAGYTSEGWVGFEKFGPVPEITDMKINLSHLCKNALVAYTVHFPGAMCHSVVWCLWEFCHLLCQKQIPYLPIVAHGVQLELDFVETPFGYGSKSLLLPDVRSRWPKASMAPYYSCWLLVDHFLEGLQRFLKSCNCWERSRITQSLSPASTSVTACLRQWFPYAFMGAWPLYPLKSLAKTVFSLFGFVGFS